MKVLITGAGGKVATAVRRELAEHGHELRLMDLRAVDEPEGEMVIGSITRRADVAKAVAGMEAVVQLVLSPDWNAAEGFEINIAGTYMLLEEALTAGVQRAVCTSSLSVYAGPKSPERRGITEEVPTVPGGGPYTLMKIFEEHIVQYFAEEKGLPATVLRLTGPLTAAEWEETASDGTGKAGSTHLEDVAQAFRLALEREAGGYEVFHIGSKHSGGELPIDKAKRVLGYRPRWGFE